LGKISTILKWVLPIILITIAIGQIVSQIELTTNLVEIGLFSWQVSRILVFILPGMVLATALILILGLSGGKRTVGFMLVLVFSGGLQFYFSWQHSVLYNLNLNWVYNGNPILIIIYHLIFLYSILFYPYKDLKKNTPWPVYGAFLCLIPLSMTHTVIYATEFQSNTSDIPEKGTVKDFNKILSNDETSYAIFFLSTSCENCMTVAKRLSITQRQHTTIPIYLVFKSTKNSIETFLETVNYSDANIFNLKHSENFEDYTGFGVPAAYIVKEGEIINFRKGFYINFNFLDLLLK